VFSYVWLKWPFPSLDSALPESKLEAATHSLLILLGGSLKAEGFGDGFSLAKHIPCESGNPGPSGPDYMRSYGNFLIWIGIRSNWEKAFLLNFRQKPLFLAYAFLRS